MSTILKTYNFYNSVLDTFTDIIQKYEDALDMRLIGDDKIQCPEPDFRKYCRDDENRLKSRTKQWHDFSMLWRTFYGNMYRQNVEQIIVIQERNFDDLTYHRGKRYRN